MFDIKPCGDGALTFRFLSKYARNWFSPSKTVEGYREKLTKSVAIGSTCF